MDHELSWFVKCTPSRPPQVFPKMLVDLLVDLQTTAREWKDRQTSISSTRQQVRQRRLPLQSLLVQTRQMQRPLPSPGSGAGLTKPFSYSQTLGIDQVVKSIQKCPERLAQVVLSARSEQTCRRMVRMILQDLCLDQDVIYRFMQSVLRGKEVQETSLSLQEITSVLTSVVLDTWGREYLQEIVGPTILWILVDLDLDLEFGASESPRGSLSSVHSSAAPSPTNNHETLLTLCEDLLSLLTSSTLPLPIHTYINILYQTTCPNSSIIDTILLHWIIPAFWNPPTHICRMFPLLPHSRTNLEAVGTIMLKLFSNSRFSTFDDHLVSINSFIDRWNPIVQDFISRITQQDMFSSPLRKYDQQLITPIIATPRDIHSLFTQISRLKDCQDLSQAIAQIDIDLDHIAGPDHYTSISLGIDDALQDHEANLSYLQQRIIYILSSISPLSLAYHNNKNSTEEQQQQSLLDHVQHSSPNHEKALIFELVQIINQQADPNQCLTDLCKLLKQDHDHPTDNVDIQQSLLLKLHMDRYIAQLKSQQERLEEMQRETLVRSILHQLESRLLHFNRQLQIRFSKMTKYSCTGLSVPSEDVFICRRCVLMNNKQKEALDIAAEDCIRVCSKDSLKQLSDSTLYSYIYEYLISISFKHVFIQCFREDGRFNRRLQLISHQFSSFNQWIEFINDKPCVQQYCTESIEIAIQQFNQIDHIQIISDISACLTDVHETLSSILSSYLDQGADEYIPLLCFILLKSSSTRFLSLLHTLTTHRHSFGTSKICLDLYTCTKMLMNTHLLSIDQKTFQELQQTLQIDPFPNQHEIYTAYDTLILSNLDSTAPSAQDMSTFILAYRVLVKQYKIPKEKACQALVLCRMDIQKCLLLLGIAVA